MRSFSRREAMLMAAAAGAVPMLGKVAAGGWDQLIPPTRCDVITDKSMVMNLWVNPPGQIASVPPRPIAPDTKSTVVLPYAFYTPVDPAKTQLIFPLPWCTHIFMTCPYYDQNNKPLPDNAHTFTVRKGGMARDVSNAPLQVKVVANYITPPPTQCCIFCGDMEICMPKGHTYLCNGIEMTC